MTEGPGFNVFAVSGGKIVTPDRNIVEGITRLAVLDLCKELGLPCEVRPVPVESCAMPTRSSSRPRRAASFR